MSDELENIDDKINQISTQLNMDTNDIQNKAEEELKKQKTEMLFNFSIDELLSDRKKVKEFVYELLDEYHTLKDTNDNFSQQLADTILSDDQKRFIYSQLKVNNRKLEMILESLPSLISIMTDIPKKTIDIYVKKLDVDRNVGTIAIQGLISREKLYE